MTGAISVGGEGCFQREVGSQVDIEGKLTYSEIPLKIPLDNATFETLSHLNEWINFVFPPAIRYVQTLSLVLKQIEVSSLEHQM